MKVMVNLDDVNGMDDVSISKTISEELHFAIRYEVKAIVKKVVAENRATIEKAVRKMLQMDDKTIHSLAVEALRSGAKDKL